MSPSTICGCNHEKKGLQDLPLPGDLKPSFESLDVEEEGLGDCALNTA